VLAILYNQANKWIISGVLLCTSEELVFEVYDSDVTNFLVFCTVIGLVIEFYMDWLYNTA
jgi:hypothetical protein